MTGSDLRAADGVVTTPLRPAPTAPGGGEGDRDGNEAPSTSSAPSAPSAQSTRSVPTAPSCHADASAPGGGEGDRDRNEMPSAPSARSTSSTRNVPTAPSCHADASAPGGGESDRDRNETPSAPSAPSAQPTRSVPTAPSCHADASAPAAPPGSAVVALVGAPNVGKSTLFNTLTGAKRTVGNWPGTTVEVGRGSWRLREGAPVVDLVDLPGAYSLDPMSPDEELTRDLLLGAEPLTGQAPEGEPAGSDHRPAVVVAAVSAAHLARSLYLVAQLRETDLPVIVAVTMADVAARRGIELDEAALATALGCPVVILDPRRRTGHDRLDLLVSRQLADPQPFTGRPGATTPAEDEGTGTGEAAYDSLDRADERFAFIERVVAAGTTHDGAERRTWSDRIDRWATAPGIGMALFLAVMWVVFQVTTTVAAPLQDALDALVSGPVSQAARAGFAAVGLGGSALEGFVVSGLIAGVGMLLTFVPLMAIMFLLLAILEDSGYMARAAVVTDRLMGRLGLPGRAFLPLVVGFGCNVPAIAATRILPTARHRLLTALLVPFTSCSARLTVYVLLAGTFFPEHAGTVVFGMYLTSIVLLVLVGLLLRRALWRTMGGDPLVLDLPPYQRPTARLSLAVMWLRLQGFLKTAGGIIVATVTVVWLLQSIPVGGGSFGHVPVAESLYADLSRLIAPLLAPAGFGAWEAVSALVVGFVAKEAVISSWAQTFALSPSAHDPGGLGAQLHDTFAAASGGHPLPAVLAFMVFLLAYTPCVATLAAQKREIGMKWTAFGLAVQLTVAWTLAVLVFQIGRLIA